MMVAKNLQPHPSNGRQGKKITEQQCVVTFTRPQKIVCHERG
jgi:hypothetical protein